MSAGFKHTAARVITSNRHMAATAIKGLITLLGNCSYSGKQHLILFMCCNCVVKMCDQGGRSRFVEIQARCTENIKFCIAQSVYIWTRGVMISAVR